MRVITLTNEKGGVGKSPWSVALAAGLALRDLRVLLIDADAQGCCAELLGAPEGDGFSRLLRQGADWDAVLVEPAAGHWSGRLPTVGELWLLPGNVQTARVYETVWDNPLALRERLADVAGRFDAVIIDTPPTPSLLHPLLFYATDAVIYVTRCAGLSLRGLDKTTHHMKQHDAERVRRGLPPVQFLGVLPTQYRDTRAHAYGRELLEQWDEKRIWNSSPLRTIWDDAEFAQQSLFAYDPEHAVIDEIEAVVEKVGTYAVKRLCERKTQSARVTE